VSRGFGNPKFFSNSFNSVQQDLCQGNYITGKVNRTSIKGLIDTGSGCSLISQSLATKLKLSVLPVRKGGLGTLFAAEGSKLHVIGEVDFTLNIGGLLIFHNFYVISNLSESLIFGTDWLTQNKVVIDYANKQVSIGDDLPRVGTGW
jgi:hypothetical protein